jgi:8-hydroxy-5-deazaflavin:NADPH oxidoreductase
MKIGIIGAGNVGQTLGKALSNHGHSIVYGVRNLENPNHQALRGPHTTTASVRDTVVQTEAIILSTPWNATEAALQAAGDFGGKPLLDVTNPIGPGFTLTHGHTDSGAEQVARWAQNANVVKVFNTTGLENMANPVYGTHRLAMFVCGDHQPSCDIASKLANELGFQTLLVGGLSKARILEPVGMLWINLALVLGYGRDIGFGLLQREKES